MDSVPTSIPEHSVNMVHFGGIVCHGHESPTLHLFLSSDRSDVRRHRCPAPELGCTIGLCISPVSHHPPSDPQTQAERALQPDSFHPVPAAESMVSGLSELLVEVPVLLPIE